MSIQRYEGEESRKTYTAPDGSTYSWILEKSQIELNYKTTDGSIFTSNFRYVWQGNYQIDKGKLVAAQTTDLAFEWRENYLQPSTAGREGDSFGYSLRYNKALSIIPSIPFNGEGARANYKYTTATGGDQEGYLQPPLNTIPWSNRDVVESYPWAQRFRDGWWVDQFSSLYNQTSADSEFLTAPSNYGKAQADIITNYNPKSDDPIQIDLASFGGAAGKLKIAKKAKQVEKLAKKNTDFIYDQQAGYLYYNENGKQAGFGDGGIFAILEGSPKVGLGNFEFV